MIKDEFLQECYDKLAAYMRLLEKRTAYKTDKMTAFAPAEGLYDAFWPDDFTFPIAGLPESLTKEAYQSIYDFLTDSILDLPCVPDRVQFDGCPIMQPGAATIGSAHGDKIPAHLPSAWVRLLCYFRDYGVQLHDKKGWFKLIKRSYEQVSFACGLVYIDVQRPHVAFAYNDSAAITGMEFMCSVVNMRGFERGLELFADVIDEETKAEWQKKIEGINNNLWRLYDEKKGGYIAGSQTCKQLHIWANGLLYGRMDGEKKERLGKTLVSLSDKIFYRGCTRQMSETEGWERMLVDMPVDFYMNGGWWATGTGYVIQAVYETDKAFGKKLLTELIEELPKFNYAEWINKRGEESLAKYFHMSIGMPLTAIKAMLEGSSLIEKF